MLIVTFGPFGDPGKFSEVVADIHFFRVFPLKKAKSSGFHHSKSL